MIPIKGVDARRVAYSSNSNHIAWAADDGMMWIWNVDEDHIERIFSLNLPVNDHVMNLAFSPSDDKIIAWTTSGDHRIHAVDRTTSDIQPRSSQTFDSAIRSIAFSPNGAQIAVGFENKAVAVCDATTLGLTDRSLTGHEAPIVSVTFSPDGSRVASGSDMSTIRIWDALTRGFQRSIQASDQVVAIAFSPDGKKLVSGSSRPIMLYSGMVQLWDVETGNMSGEEAFFWDVCSVAFSPDGKHIAAGFRNGEVKIWDTRLELEWSSETHSEQVDYVAFSSDGSRFVSASGTKIYVWNTKVADQPVPPTNLNDSPFLQIMSRC
jgi:WD40 repeat protein